MKAKKKPRYDLVEVEWFDAWHDNVNTVTSTQLAAVNVQLRRSSGYLARNDDNVVVLVSDVDYHDDDPTQETDHDCYWVIPKAWVKAIHTARKGREKKPKQEINGAVRDSVACLNSGGASREDRSSSGS